MSLGQDMARPDDGTDLAADHAELITPIDNQNAAPDSGAANRATHPSADFTAGNERKTTGLPNAQPSSDENATAYKLIGSTVIGGVESLKLGEQGSETLSVNDTNFSAASTILPPRADIHNQASHDILSSGMVLSDDVEEHTSNLGAPFTIAEEENTRIHAITFRRAGNQERTRIKLSTTDDITSTLGTAINEKASNILFAFKSELMADALEIDIGGYIELLGLSDLTDQVCLYLRAHNIELLGGQIVEKMSGLEPRLQSMSASGDQDMRQRGRQLAKRVREMVEGNEGLEACYKELMAGTVFSDKVTKEKQRKKENAKKKQKKKKKKKDMKKSSDQTAEEQ